MDNWKKLKKSTFKFIFPVLVVALSIGLMQACSKTENLLPRNNKQDTKHTITKPIALTEKTLKLPITPPNGEFFKVGGWLSDNQLFYITNYEQTSFLYKYTLTTGKSELIYKSDEPIVTAVVSPSKESILIQSSPSTYEGIITVIDTMGTIKWNQPIPSYELEYEWNPYNESELLVTSFMEDWSYKVYLGDIKNKKLTNISMSQPFVKWVDEKKIAYLNWDQNNSDLFAPLIVKGLYDHDGKTVVQNVFQFTAFRNILMDISVNENEKTKAVYTFFDQKLHSFFSFTMPQLSKFSDWLVPYYDYNDNKKSFITFRPLRSAEADVYSDGFQLVSFNIKKGTSSILLKDLKNEPLSCSPSGEACLYGGSFEKLINLKTKEIFQLIKKK